jgi:putative transposase
MRKTAATRDHMIGVTADGLRRVLREYIEYYEHSRTHPSLNKAAPIPRPIAAPADGRVVAIPHVGGLHHRYEWQAA